MLLRSPSMRLNLCGWSREGEKTFIMGGGGASEAGGISSLPRGWIAAGTRTSPSTSSHTPSHVLHVGRTPTRVPSDFAPCLLTDGSCPHVTVIQRSDIAARPSSPCWRALYRPSLRSRRSAGLKELAIEVLLHRLPPSHLHHQPPRRHPSLTLCFVGPPYAVPPHPLTATLRPLASTDATFLWWLADRSANFVFPFSSRPPSSFV